MPAMGINHRAQPCEGLERQFRRRVRQAGRRNLHFVAYKAYINITVATPNALKGDGWRHGGGARTHGGSVRTPLGVPMVR